MLESLKVKVKPESKAKEEGGAATPSPAKKLATEMEKKLKNIPGDTTLMKARLDSPKIISGNRFLYQNIHAPYITYNIEATYSISGPRKLKHENHCLIIHGFALECFLSKEMRPMISHPGARNRPAL